MSEVEEQPGSLGERSAELGGVIAGVINRSGVYQQLSPDDRRQFDQFIREKTTMTTGIQVIKPIITLSCMALVKLAASDKEAYQLLAETQRFLEEQEWPSQPL